MHVRFDPTFDRGSWPDPLDGAPAAAGRVNVGPLGLLDILETALGLGGLHLSEAERTAALLPSLRARGYWSASAASDPFGTARRLLRQRDDLMLEGWSGEPVSERLDQLASVTESAPPGIPDRLAAVNHALAQKWGARAAESIRRLTVLEPDTDLPMRWRSALERLQAQGTHLERSRFQPAPQAATDLGAMQRTLLGQGAGAIPLVSGDGSLGLLRSGGVIVAAEATAAWLAALRERVRDASIVVVNADPVLDDALARHGMPTTGSASSGVPPAMAVLPLALSLLWHPRDAARARELLLVPDGPVPFAVARALVAALDSWPAVGSPAWEWRLARALDGRADEEAVRLVLQVLFGPESVTRDGQPALPATPLPHGTPCPPERLWALLDQLAAWWTGALADGAANAEGVWAQVGRQLASFRLLTTSALSFGASRAPGWSAPELMRLAEAAATDAERGASASARRPAQAGLSVVRDPGSVAGPVDYVAWWDFTDAAEGKASEVRLSDTERSGLEKLGVRPPDFGARAVARAARYARPLLGARHAILLVAPTRGADGEEAHPHPLWDECVVHLGDKALAAISPVVPRLPSPQLTGTGSRQMSLWASEPRRGVRHLSPPPGPRRAWSPPVGSITARPLESPSGLQSLLGCEFQWAVKYLGQVRPGIAAASPPPNMFRGNVAHEVLSQVVTSRAVWSGTGGTMAERARRAAVSLFDQQADRLWAHLGMPGSEADRAELRQIVEASASWLAHALEEGGYTSVVAETKLEAPLGEGMLSGTPDLVLGPTAAVLDLKLGSATSKRKALEAGTAVQLAAYSWLVTRNGRASDLPPVGYFVMTAGRLLTTEPDAFPRSTHVEGPDIHSTWTAVDSTLRSTLAALRDGRLSARGVACGEEKVVERAHLVDDVIVLEPPCRFCEYGGLCGRSFGQMERDVDGG